MSMKYENFENSESENKSQCFGNGLSSPQALLRSVCSGLRPVLLILGLSLLLLVGICVLGSQSSKSQRDLVTLRDTFSSSSSNTSATVQALRSQGDSMREALASLGTEMEKRKQELQAVHGLNDKVLSLEKQLEKQHQELKAGDSEVLQMVQQLARDLKFLTCEVAALKSNGSQTSCCPLNWMEHEGRCYWFSDSQKTWADAEKYCRLEDAHLVVINSRDEQDFVQKHIGSSYTWMGLSDPEGVWKWVDGTDYETNFKNWKPGQPDDWHGHGLGGGEDCAHFHPDGKWNDDVCQRLYYWTCETSIGKPN